MARGVQREGVRRRVRLSSKNQITIPVSVLREMGVQPGDELEIAQNGREAIIRPAGDLPWMRLVGRLPGMWPEGHLDALRDECDPCSPRSWSGHMPPAARPSATSNASSPL